MNDIIKIVQALEDSNILLKVVTETVRNETKEQNGGIFGMFLGTLGVSLLGNLLTGKGFVRAGSGNNKGKYVVIAGYCNKNKGKGVARVGYDNKNKGKGVVRAGYGNKLKNKVNF